MFGLPSFFFFFFFPSHPSCRIKAAFLSCYPSPPARCLGRDPCFVILRMFVRSVSNGHPSPSPVTGIPARGDHPLILYTNPFAPPLLSRTATPLPTLPTPCMMSFVPSLFAGLTAASHAFAGASFCLLQMLSIFLSGVVCPLPTLVSPNEHLPVWSLCALEFTPRTRFIFSWTHEVLSLFFQYAGPSKYLCVPFVLRSCMGYSSAMLEEERRHGYSLVDYWSTLCFFFSSLPPSLLQYRSPLECTFYDETRLLVE